MRKNFDWSAMVEELNKTTSMEEIARRTGTNLKTLEKIKKDYRPVDQFDQAIKLLDMYLKMVAKVPPKFGER